MVRLTIEDGGPGVPPEALPRLFEKFYRVPRKGEGSRRGTGIGLAVVRGIVEAMGGQVRARTSSLGGLALDVDLPAAPPPAPAGAGGCAVSPPRRSCSWRTMSRPAAPSPRSSRGMATRSSRPVTRPPRPRRGNGDGPI